MSLKKCLFNLLAILLFVMAISVKAQEVTVDAKHVRGSVYMLRSNSNIGNPTSVACIDSSGTFLADANLLIASEALDAKLQELGSKDLKYVISSHHHGDHSEGFEYFYTQATLITPMHQREHLETGNIVKGGRPIIPEALPQLTFEKKIVIYLGDEEIEVFTPPHQNAHTNGDAFVYFRNANVLYVGDHLFLDHFPIVDVESGGDLFGVLSNLEEVLQSYNDNLIILPGHGTFPPNEIAFATKADVQKNIDLLKASVEFVQAKIKAGKTLEQIQEEGFPEKFDIYNSKPQYVSPEKWIKFVYENYKS